MLHLFYLSLARFSGLASVNTMGFLNWLLVGVAALETGTLSYGSLVMSMRYYNGIHDGLLSNCRVGSVKRFFANKIFLLSLSMIYFIILENPDIRNLLPLEIWKMISGYLFMNTRKMISKRLVFPQQLNVIYEDFFDSYTFTCIVKNHKWRIIYHGPLTMTWYYFNDEKKYGRYKENIFFLKCVRFT